MKKYELRAVLSGGVVATLMSKSSLHADTFGTNDSNTGPFADSSTHDYCIVDPAEWIAPEDTWVHQAMEYIDSTTDITRSSVACASGTDARVEMSNLTGETRGAYNCRVALDASGRCGSGRIQIDNNEISWQAHLNEWGNWYVAYERNMHKTLRHEIGHSIGMRHHFAVTVDLNGDGTTAANETTLAMNSGHVFDPAAILFNQHHKDHVNNAY